MRHAHEVAAVRELRVRVAITKVLDGIRLEAGLLKARGERVAVLRRGPGLELLLELVDVREPAGRRCETVVGPRGQSHGVDERAPLLVRPGRDRDPAVVAGASERAVRRRVA